MGETALGIEVLNSYKPIDEKKLDEQLLACVKKNKKKISSRISFYFFCCLFFICKLFIS